MRQRDSRASEGTEKTVRDIHRATRRQFSAEKKIRIVLEVLRGEESSAELCRKERIAQTLCYRWSKEFLEAGKKRLAGDTAREAISDEDKALRAEARQLKEALAEGTLENRLLKKCVIGEGRIRPPSPSTAIGQALSQLHRSANYPRPEPRLLQNT